VRPGARRLPLPAVLAALVLLVPATPALADSLPPVPIDVTETVGASDGAAALNVAAARLAVTILRSVIESSVRR